MVAENVKSVTRVFQVLECFERERRPLSATSIAQALSYPQSSTQAVLKTMVNTGYLTYDSHVRAYFPTPKLLQNTGWLADVNSSLLHAMEDLHNLTGETITLSCYRNTDMQVVQLILGNHPIALTLRPGDRIALFASTVGLAFLADQTDEVIQRLIRRGQKQATSNSSPAVDPGRIKAAISLVRKRGAAVGYGLVMEGVGAVAGAIRCPVSGATYVLCAGGPDARIRLKEKEIVSALCDVVDSHSHTPQGFLESTVRPGLERMTRRFEAHLEEQLRDVGINSKESQLIGLLLAQGALDTEQMVALGLVSRSSLKRTLGSLGKKNLISKNQTRYSLTPSGRRLAESLSEKLRAYRKKALGPVSPSEAEELQHTLDRLSEWIKSASSTKPEVS